MNQDGSETLKLHFPLTGTCRASSHGSPSCHLGRSYPATCRGDKEEQTDRDAFLVDYRQSTRMFEPVVDVVDVVDVVVLQTVPLGKLT